MTPQQRSRRTYWLLLVGIVFGLVIGNIIVESENASFWILGTVMTIAVIIQYRVNRCPHCRKMIDLRSDAVRYCPRCGEEIK